MIFSKTLNKYYLKYLHFFLLGAAALIAVDLAQLEIPLIARDLINTLEQMLDTGETSTAFLVDIVRTLLFLTVFIVIGRFFWRFGIIGASRRIDYDLRNEMFAHCTKLSNNFYAERKVGGLMAHFTNDLEAVRRSIGPGLIMMVDAAFLGILVFWRMFSLEPRMTALLVFPLVIIAVIGMVLGTKMRLRFREAQKAFENLSDFTNESFSGISVVKAFVKERTEIREFLKSNKNAKDKNVRFVRIATIMEMAVRVIVSLVIVIIIGYGAHLVQSTSHLPFEERFTLGDLVAFIQYFMMLIWPMMALSRIIHVRSQGKASLERIEAILHAPIDVEDDENVRDINAIKGSIEFRDLYFRYPDGDANALEAISFSVEAGQTIGILGRTGSGKTSVVDLLLRIYNVNPGQLFIDGIDIMKLPVKKVRDSIGYVPQDGFLFSDTIRNNISLGVEDKDDVDINQIQTMAKLSDVHDNIAQFKHGYETIIGERGVTLSGGQKQRVSIARALAKEPPILIMDDSVSAVDTSTEEKILKNLKKVRKGKTTIIIAHRISTVKNADKIVVIDDGRVVDVGTHEELERRCELYQDMVRRQQLEDAVEVA